MGKIQRDQSLCSCGSGRSYDQCCGFAKGGLVIHFPRAKKSNYMAYLENCMAELIGYARRYFYNWETEGASRFTSYSQFNEIDDHFTQMFWHWYVINYRFHSDVSPIIDFYIAEKEDEMDQKHRDIYHAIKESYLSIYQVQWIKNNVVSLKGLLSRQEVIVERNFGSLTRIVEPGSLLLARVVKIDNSPVILGKPTLVFSEHKKYLAEEINSVCISEGISNPCLFLKSHAEVLTGLVMDLNQGLKKTRIKARTLVISALDKPLLSKKLLSGEVFTLLEQNDKWLKFTWGEGTGLLRRLYFSADDIIVVAEDHNQLGEATQMLKGILENTTLKAAYRWIEGYDFSSEEVAGETMLEIMHDKHMEEWLTSNHQELDGMTPLQAVEDVRGRVLLESMLSDLELMEFRARSRGEYFFPTTVIRTKLNLDHNNLNKDLLNPVAIAVMVSRHRARQELSQYVTAYNWSNEEYCKVAVAMFDLYIASREYKRMAWMLYIWHEFSTIYRPKVAKAKYWIAALEHIYLACIGERVNFAWTAKKFGVPVGVVSKHVQLIEKHFKRFPLDFKLDLSNYPTWEELSEQEKIDAFEEVQQHLQLFTYAMKHTWSRDENLVRMEYYELVNSAGRFWDEATKKVYEQFFKDHINKDDLDGQQSTIANYFWENQARRFPPYLRRAAFILMMSYVGAYRVIPTGYNQLIFEDIFTGEKREAIGRFGDRVHDNIVPGMISITRVLPLDNKLWISEPMFTVMPDLIELFQKNADILMENLHPYDITDYKYLKKRGERLVKAYIMSLDEMEQIAVNLMNQPLYMEWQIAQVINSKQAIQILKQNRKFRVLSSDSAGTTFIWMSFNSNQMYQWGYVRAGAERIAITLPPGKDLDKFIKDIRRAFKSADIVVAFRPFEAGFNLIKDLQQRMIADLAAFFNRHPELSLALLRQDDLKDEETAWNQGIFLLKLGALLMDYLEENRKTD